MRLLWCSLMLAAVTARAETVVTLVLDGPGVNEAAARKIQKTADSVVQQVVALKAVDSPSAHKGAPRKCADDCVQSAMQAAQADTALVLEVKALGADKWALDCAFWVGAQKSAPRHVETNSEGLEAALKPVVETLVPGWMRRGFGGVELRVEAGATAKLDGRVLAFSRGEVLAVPAGVHFVDIVFRNGSAVLQKFEVAEGQRLPLEVAPLDAAVTAVGRKPGISPLRTASYAVFVVGAATLAGGIIAGSLARRTGADVTACSNDTRVCTTLEDALAKNQQAATYASTGNILVGVGASLAAAGAGMFIIDAVTAE